MEQFYYEYQKNGRIAGLEQYVYRIGSYHYNWHNALELLLIVNGEVEVCTSGGCSILKPDDFLLINSNMGHATLAKEPNSIAMVLHIDPVFLKDYYENIEFLFFELHTDNGNREDASFKLIRKNLSEMLLCAGKAEPENKLLFESSFYSLMHTIIALFPPREIQSAHFRINQKKLDVIEKMSRYIDKNYRKKISLDTLAKESGYNPSYVSQLFKSYLGINFYDYLTRIRLREATRALSQSEKKILDIALDNGFSDLKSFNSLFKETFQKSPTEYRRQLNTEHSKHDILFKKEFISTEDSLVNHKLAEYILKGSGGFPAALEQHHTDYACSSDALNCMVAELTDALAHISGELTDTAHYIDEKIKKLPENNIFL